MSASNKGAGVDPRLQSLTNALLLNDSDDVALRVEAGGITITAGSVNVDAVKLWDGSHYVQLEMPNNDGEPGGYSISTENYNMMFNGSTWDRVRGNTSDGLLTKITNSSLNVAQGTIPWQISGNAYANSNSNPIYTQFLNNSLAVTGTFWQDTQPVSLTALPDGQVTLKTGSNLIGKVDVNNWPATQAVSITSMPVTPISDNGSSITIDGTVNINSMPEVEIKNDTNNPIPVSKNLTANSDTNPIFVKGTSDTSFFSATQSDAFGRLRVSNPFPLFDSFHRFQDNGKITEYTSGSASSTYDANSCTIQMTVGTSLGDKIYRESAKVFAYQPGKSLLILQTFCMNVGKTGLRQRQGYFDVANGIYLELNETTLNFVRRTSVSGTLQEYRVSQANWSEDTMLSGNSKNPSGITLDISKVQIFWMDIEWLGVGSVRLGFVVNGQFIHCHTFHHANKQTVLPHSDTTLPYMATACLPVRAELENISNTSNASYYRLICTSVVSEGGYTLSGRPRNMGHTISTPRTISSGVLYPLMTIRLKSSRLNAIVLPQTFSVAVTGNTNYRWSIVAGGSTTNGAWVSAGNDSSVEYNLTGTSFSGGTQLESGFIINSNQSATFPSLAETPFKFQLERNSFTGVASEFTICIETSGSNVTSWASINWDEVT